MPLICLLLPVATALAAEPAMRVTSTIRGDSRTGRLVRKTVVSPAPMAARAMTATTVALQEVAPKLISPTPVAEAGLVPRVLDNVDVNAVVDQAAKANELDPLLVHSVIKAESNYNPSAISPKGARGLMQLMPGTARRFGVLNTFDVRQNIEAGVKYLKYLQQMFQDDRLALAAYNAGEGAVIRYGNVPPYPETENYVYKVGKNYGDALRRRGQASPVTVSDNAAGSEAGAPVAEPLRQLEVARDAEGRIVLRTR